MNRIFGIVLIAAFVAWKALVVTAKAELRPGSLDGSFDPQAPLTSTRALAVDSEARILALGYGSSFSASIVRLSTDGSLDTNFSVVPVGYSFISLFALGLQGDQKIVFAGAFGSVAQTPPPSIARVNPDGTFDAAFDPVAANWYTVYSLRIQSNGGILVGGNFTQIEGYPRNHVARFGANGKLDATFNPGFPAVGDNFVYAVAVQSDGRVLVGAQFPLGATTTEWGLVRLQPDGGSDPTFVVPMVGVSVKALAIQTDGRILAGGNFSMVQGTPQRNIVRLNRDGTIDDSFRVLDGPNGDVDAVLIQPDGRIILGGHFTSCVGAPRSRIARLNPDGTLDTTFDPGAGADAAIYGLALQGDGKVLLGGSFTAFAGSPRRALARLNTDDPASPLLSAPRIQENAFTVSATTTPTNSYALEFRDAVTNTNWQSLPVVAGDGTVKVLRDPNPISGSKFYRLRVQ